MAQLVCPLILLAAAVLVPLVWAVATYNRFVALRQHLRESWADVDVELKRRHDLIPNLVETVRGHAAHERAMLEAVTAARDATARPDRPASLARDEARLGRELRHLFAVAEGYPRLKSDANFRRLQRELATTEDRLAAARRFYNGNVRENNALVAQFPSSLIANSGGFAAAEYFEVAADAERAVPRVAI